VSCPLFVAIILAKPARVNGAFCSEVNTNVESRYSARKAHISTPDRDASWRARS
jgi:hypothetical protein